MYDVVLSVTLTLSAEAFDTTAQASYIAALAAAAGVATSSITLTISAASVTLIATLRLATEGEAANVVSLLQIPIASSASSSTFLGYSIASTPEQPTVTSSILAAPSPPLFPHPPATPPERPPPPSSTGGDSGGGGDESGGGGGGGAGLAIIMLFVGAALGYGGYQWLSRRRKQQEKERKREAAALARAPEGASIRSTHSLVSSNGGGGPPNSGPPQQCSNTVKFVDRSYTRQTVNPDGEPDLVHFQEREAHYSVGNDALSTLLEGERERSSRALVPPAPLPGACGGGKSATRRRDKVGDTIRDGDMDPAAVSEAVAGAMVMGGCAALADRAPEGSPLRQLQDTIEEQQRKIQSLEAMREQCVACFA